MIRATVNLMIVKFKGLVKGSGEPRIKLEGNEAYIVIPEGARVKHYFLGGVIYYCIEHGGDKRYFKVKLGSTALGDWVEPLRPDEWAEVEKIMERRGRQ